MVVEGSGENDECRMTKRWRIALCGKGTRTVHERVRVFKEIKECARNWRVIWLVSWALVPVYLVKSRAETGRSAHLTGEEVKEGKEIGSCRCAWPTCRPIL